MPAIALPMIKVMEEGAAPHIADAISKVSTLRNSVYLTEKKVKSFPKSSWSAQVDKR